MFVKYMHLEHFGRDEVEGIEIGKAYVFPKLDGTNAQVYLDGDTLKAGSRNRELTLENDNAGFYNAIINDSAIKSLLVRYPSFTIYGEWLVPHSLKTYRDDAWRVFYAFDVYCRDSGRFLPYEEYKEIFDEHGVTYLPPLGIVRNGSLDHFQKFLDKNVFLIKEGEGVGEGIVIKNYDYLNRFGNVVWAKIITNAFKEVHHREMGAPEVGVVSTEERIVEKFVTQHLVDKVYAKIVNEEGSWSSKYIPRLLNSVFYDLITEDTWAILKEFKNPKIDFGFLQRLTISRIKQLKKDLF